MSNVIEKSRLWCFTSFDLDFDYQAYLDSSSAQYIIVGRETCPKSKKLHDQGFVYFSGARRRSAFKSVAKQLGNSHVSMCNGNLDQNCDYCGKDDKVREFGTKPKQGHRTDLEAVANQILSGSVSVRTITCENPSLYHQYGRTLTKLEDIALRKKYRSWRTSGTWLWGITGSGKSHKAFEGFDPDTHYIFPNDKGWWDAYTGQETVIIDEFRGNIKYAELLALLDKYPKSVRRRCREPVPFLAKHIIITSSMPPADVYHNIQSGDKLAQLLRRIDVVHMAQKWSEGNTSPQTDLELLCVSPDSDEEWDVLE